MISCMTFCHDQKAMNLNSVLLTCKSDNYASAKIIEKNHGIFHSEILDKENNKTFKRIG